MANVINRTTKQYMESVNTPEYPVSNWIINPNMANVQNVPQKYWKINGDNVEEMTQREKQAVDDSELQVRKDTANDYRVDLKIALTALIKVINQRLSGNQKITKDEMIQALKDEII